MKRKTRGKTCRKVGYKDKSSAREAFKTFGKARGATRFYKCPYHDEEMWHLTSQED